MLFHLLDIVQMLLGIALLFAAVILWSRFKGYSSASLSVTALLFYSRIALELLERYSIIDSSKILVFKGIPILSYGLPLLLLSAFIATLLVFMHEEKRLK